MGYTEAGGSSGGAASIVVGNPVTGGVANGVLYEDASQNLKAEAAFTYVETTDTLTAINAVHTTITASGLSEFSGQTNISGPDATTNVEIGSTANDANAGTGGTSVVIGNSATNTGNATGVVLIGSTAAITSGNNKTIVGAAAIDTSTGTAHTLIGRNATITNGNSVTVIGDSAAGSQSGAIVLGASAVGNGTSSIVIGNSASASAGSSNVVIGQSSTGGSGGTSVVIGTSAVNTGNVTGAVIIGASANKVNAGNGAVVIGSNSAVQASGTGNIVIGPTITLQGAGGSANIAIGQTMTLSSTGTNNLMISNQGTWANNPASSIGLGAVVAVTGSNQFVAGGAGGFGIYNVYFGEGVVDATATAYTINGTGGSGSDNAGAALQLAGGKGTGLSAGGNVILQTSQRLATGSTAQTLYDRHVVVAGTKALTAGAATGVVRIGVPQGLAGPVGVTIYYAVRAADATDFQLRRGSVHIAAVNKAGAETAVISAASEVLDGSVLAQSSASTLTYALTVASNAADTVDFEINAVSGLTETTLDVQYTVLRDHGTGTIVAL